MKLVESFLGFKVKKSAILEQRNSILRLLLIFNLPALIVLLLTNIQVPTPYMDEQFHYSQFLRIYNGDYVTWDSKITTPPGLYYIQKIFSFVIGSELWAMRALNVFFANLLAVFCLKVYDFQDHNRNNLMRSLNLLLTPTLFFFYFVDYTDCLSLSLITMAYYYCLVGSVWRMGIFSLLSVYVRQNNIIWCAYLLFYRIIVDYSSSIASIHGNIFKSIFCFLKLMLSHREEIVKKNIGQILVFPTFLFYLYRYNEGRVLFGDHEHHTPTFHPTQMLYLSLFLCLNLPITLNDLLHCFRETFHRLYYSRHAFAAYLFLLAGCLVMVDKFSYVHPFILSDNRHYIFYIYRYFKWAKYPLCLVYPYIMIMLVRHIVTSQEKLVKFILWASASLVYLMLSELVEVRYFSIPFVILAFEIKNRSISLDIEKIHGSNELKMQKLVGPSHRMIIPTLLKLGANVIVFYMFLFREFGDQSRFIW